MKINVILIGMLLLVLACNNEQPENTASEDLLETNLKDSLSAKSIELPWKYDYNSGTDEFELVQSISLNDKNLKAEDLERMINESWPKVQIAYLQSSNDTVFISIPDSETLTQQMGSAGAMGFMISTTFNFTELKGVNSVSFNFDEGDHARPGVYNRNSWAEDSIVVKRLYE